MNARVTVGLALALAAGATHRSPSLEAQTPRASVIDSILPTAESLARFQGGLQPVSELRSGASSLEALMSSFEGALQRDDGGELASLALTKAEYAYLYYPSSAYAREPYDLPPEIAWMLHEAASGKGLRRIVRRIGGEDFQIDGYRCASQRTEGANRVFHDCAVTYRSRETFVTRSLFGGVIERGGRFKFFSYANDF